MLKKLPLRVMDKRSEGKIKISEVAVESLQS